MNDKPEVLICYAPEDEQLMRELERQLRVLEQQNLITIWHNGLTPIGFDAEQEMHNHLASAHIILLLVSAELMAPANGPAIQQALERHLAGTALVIPVILKYVLWQFSSFGTLKPLPHNGNPVTGSAWRSRDEAFANVVEGVEAAARKLYQTAAPLETPSPPAPSTPKNNAIPSTFASAYPCRVFLCHNDADKSEVIKIALELKKRDIRPWLDVWELRPGLPWQRALQAEIARIDSAAIFVGKSGVAPWQNMVLDTFIAQFVRRGCPVIPALLPDAPDQPDLPLFLENMTWVDFRNSDPDPLQQLIWGITGQQN